MIDIDKFAKERCREYYKEICLNDSKWADVLHLEHMWKDGYNLAEADCKKKLADVLKKQEIMQEEMLKVFGLKLVCWDYENDCLDVAAQQLLDFTEKLTGRETRND